MTESRLKQRLVIEVFEDGRRVIEGFGWDEKPTVAIISGKNQPYPWIVATEPWTVHALGLVLASAMDVVLDKEHIERKKMEKTDDDSD